MYEYQATVIKVVDGDTIHAEVDLGFDIRARMKFRLAGINAPELHTPEGKDAAGHLDLLLHIDPAAPTVVTINTQKDKKEKYGRYLAIIWYNGLNINAQMVTDKFAVPYDGGAR